MRLLCLALIPTFAFAGTSPQDCFSIKNNLDRKYCMDKYLESVSSTYAGELKTWTGSGISEADKAAQTESLATTIANKRDNVALLQAEITMAEKQLESVKALTPSAAPAPAPAKKKKKSKGLFGIKL